MLPSSRKSVFQLHLNYEFGICLFPHLALLLFIPLISLISYIMHLFSTLLLKPLSVVSFSLPASAITMVSHHPSPFHCIFLPFYPLYENLYCQSSTSCQQKLAVSSPFRKKTLSATLHNTWQGFYNRVCGLQNQVCSTAWTGHPWYLKETKPVVGID